MSENYECCYGCGIKIRRIGLDDKPEGNLLCDKCRNYSRIGF